jgi:hypothetical protein
MVPGQDFRQLKPNSGTSAGTLRHRRKEISSEMDFDAEKNRIQFDDGGKRFRIWQRCVPFIASREAGT